MDTSDSFDAIAEDEVSALRNEIALLRSRLARIEGEAVVTEAMENSSEAIAVYDADGKLVVCNQNFRDLYGYSIDEAKPGVHFAELGRIDIERGNVVIGDEYGDGDAYLKRKLEYRDKLEGSFVVRLKDGRWIKTTDRRMQRGGFVSVQVDVTDMKKNEQSLRDAMEAAEKATQFKSEFLANISHDLRTPLNAIIGFSAMILTECRGPLVNPDYRSYIEDIMGSGELLLSIVNDILDTAKLDSGKFVLAPEWFNPITCSENVVKRLMPITSEKSQTISIDKETDFPEIIRTDRRAIVQILNNLLSNAAKHSEIGAVIAIRWYEPAVKRIAVSITDTGAGMPPEILEKIGDPFLQDGSYAVQDTEKGAGLGLYICSKLVDTMGGDMKVESEIGQGTSVTINWPANGNEQAL